MHPLSKQFFIRNKIDVAFTDAQGNIYYGHVVEQKGSKRYKLTDGTHSMVADLIQNTSGCSTVFSLPPSSATITSFSGNSDLENVSDLAFSKCSTIQGNSYSWGLSTPSTDRVQITSTSFVRPYQPILPPQNFINVTNTDIKLSSDGSTALLIVDENGAVSSYVWNINTGNFSSIPSLGGNVTNASAISSNGSVVAGVSTDSGGNSWAFYWDGSTGITHKILPLPSGATSSQMDGMSADGSVICGSTNSNNLWYWTSSGVVDLGTGSFNGISKDGTTIIGVSGGAPTMWSLPSTNPLTLPVLSGSPTSSTPQYVSTNGSIIVGISVFSGGVMKGWTWDATNGVVDIGTPVANDYSIALFGMSDDGSVIIGSNGVGTPQEYNFYWKSNSFTDYGNFDPSAYSLSTGGVSGNGLFITGNSYDNQSDNLNGFINQIGTTNYIRVPSLGSINKQNIVTMSQDASVLGGTCWSDEYQATMPCIWR